FFQAEDGIRDYKVTGVQTCALPILAGGAELGCLQIRRARRLKVRRRMHDARARRGDVVGAEHQTVTPGPRGVDPKFAVVLQARRSEERRVGKECRAGGWRGEDKEAR